MSRSSLHSTTLRRSAALVWLLALGGTAAPAIAQVPPKRSAAAALDLGSAYPPSWSALLDGNRTLCRIDGQGSLCRDIGGPFGAGGFWPDLPNQYVFNSGIQIAAIVRSSGGPWAGDTVGAYFADLRGTSLHGERVTSVYSSAEPEHLDVWPAGAVIHESQAFHPSLLGKRALSAEDSWLRYWDGPRLLSGRAHPMGVLVEQRSLQFTYPVGNEDILYWVFTLTNITASDPAAYDALDPAVRDDIAQLGAEWVAETEAEVGVDLPSSGVPFDSLYVGLAMDPDVGNASMGIASAVLPFNTSIAYKSNFSEPGWRYSVEIAAPPFGPRPGFVGAALLRTPPTQSTGQLPGMTVFSTMTGSSQFPPPRGVETLWRYLSMNITPADGDPVCDINPPKERRLCSLVQQPTDTRFFQSTGPFALDPGQSATIVMAYVFAAAVDSIVAPFVGGTLPPGIPPAGPDLASGLDTLRVLERAAGWLSHSDANGDGDIKPAEVEAVPRSFLAKVKLAQAVAANGFLLPSAPRAPEFFLVPGDDRVTVVWKPSTTEATGDPFFPLASDPTSGVHDPNFRANDVEGYRIYRGRSPEQLELVAQFDHAGTTFVDYTGALDYGEGCAPELGLTDGCPTFPVTRELRGTLVQILPGGRVAVGATLATIRADTVSGLRDTGVPFALVDTEVQNFYPYYYAVTAFDVNSAASGPASLESPLVARSVVPRREAANVGQAQVSTGLYGRGRLLEPQQTFTFDGTTGTFTGAPPPTGLLAAAYELFVPAAVRVGASVKLRIDSVIPSYYEGEYWLTLEVDGQTSRLFFTGLPISSHDPSVSAPFHAPLAADAARADKVRQPGLPFAGQATFEFRVDAVTFYSGDTEWHRDVDGAFWTWDQLTGIGGSRWFTGEDETTPMPGTLFWRGALPGVTTIFTPQPNWSGGPWGNVYALFRRARQSTWHAARQADVKFYWGGAPGTLDSVIDVTHNVPVPFASGRWVGVGWGFRDDITGIGTSYSPPDGVVTAYDFTQGPCYSPLNNGLPSHSTPGCETRPFAQRATLQPVDVTGDNVADGQGFALYFNHEFYIFRTGQLPANTVWTHRSYFGVIDGTPGAWTYADRAANPAVPGLVARVTVDSAATTQPITAATLERVHTVPDPFYVTSHLGQSPAQRVLKFVNLPDRAIIRIYSLSGVLVAIVEHHDPTLGGETTWDLRNRNGRLVASGVYFYHVETPDGAQTVGRMTIISGGNFGVP
jgi:hypothetical protein